MDRNVHIFTDGGSRGNPGPGACAYVVVIGIDMAADFIGGRAIRKGARYLGSCTNNEAEYNAILDALMWSRDRMMRGVLFHSDSELVVRQLRGEYKVRSKALAPLHQTASRWMETCSIGIVHHSREHPWIKVCDRMVNDMLDAHSRD